MLRDLVSQQKLLFMLCMNHMAEKTDYITVTVYILGTTIMLQRISNLSYDKKTKLRTQLATFVTR